jgi:hypothetical protein
MRRCFPGAEVSDVVFPAPNMAAAFPICFVSLLHGRRFGSCRCLVPFCVVVVYTAWPNTVAVSSTWQLPLCRLYTASSLYIRLGRILLLCRLLGSCRCVASTLCRRCLYGLAEYCCCVVYLAAVVVVSSNSASSSRLARALTTRSVSLGAWTKAF